MPKFKICPNCGYTHLTEKKQSILSLLPTTAKDISEKLNMTNQQTHAELCRLVKLDKIKRNGKYGKYVMFEKIINNCEDTIPFKKERENNINCYYSPCKFYDENFEQNCKNGSTFVSICLRYMPEKFIIK